MPKCQASHYLRLPPPPPPHCHSTHWALQTYTTVTSLTMTPDVYLKVGTPSYRATCWYKNLSYSDMSLFYQKQYLSFLMISISATCRNMRGYTVLVKNVLRRSHSPVPCSLFHKRKSVGPFKDC